MLVQTCLGGGAKGKINIIMTSRHEQKFLSKKKKKHREKRKEKREDQYIHLGWEA